MLSPDGGWIAYVGVDSGTPQIFVSAFPNPGGGRTQVSLAGGSQPKWAGRELFYTGLDGTLMSAPTNAGATFTVGTPTRVFERPYYGGLALLSRAGTYDVTPDGQRFLMLEHVGSPDQSVEQATVIVIKNWIEELRRLVPPGR